MQTRPIKTLLQTLALLVSCLLIANHAAAQSATDDFLRQTGKIYVVVAVVLMLFIGFFVVLIRLDRKVSRLERETSPSRRTSTQP